MAGSNQRGSRLLVSLVDDYAQNEPGRVWASIPSDDNDISKGFTDVTYRVLGNAVNYAASWLQQHLAPAVEAFETVAYAGPKDIRYPILAIAVAKVGRKLLLPSPYASIGAQRHLLAASNCQTYLFAAPLKDTVNTVISNMQHHEPAALQVPGLSELLQATQPTQVPYTKLWGEAKTDPWLIFHTSGTTGLPKLVTYTHQMMASLDAAESMPDANRETMNRHFENRRWYTPLPSLHFVGMTVSLQFTVFLGSILVVGPANPGPTTPQAARDTIRYGKAQGVMLPPALIDGLCEDEIGLHTLRSLDYLYFAGAPLMRKTAEKLLGHVVLKPAMGSTEAGAYFLDITDDDDWEYYSFRPAMGFRFRQATDDLYEPVFIRQPSLERWQQVFQVYQDKEEFPTNDLFSKHPSKPGRWKYIGRTDDMIAFSHGENLYASGIEEEISRHPSVLGVLIGGQGRPMPYVIVEWKDDHSSESAKLDNLWPVIEQVNQRCSDLVKIKPGMVIFAPTGKRLVRTVKGSVSRRESEQAFIAEIAGLYGDTESLKPHRM